MSSAIASGARLRIGHLEIHAAHACNLACESCSHYSNHGHKGLVSLEDADAWMRGWSGRVDPQLFSVVGGEPTIHPELPEFLATARRHWPKAVIRLVSNGFFLHRHPDLPRLMRDDRNIVLFLSIHHRSEEYQQRLVPVMRLLDGWIAEYGIRVHVYRSDRMWTRRYKGFGSEMEPFEDGSPRESWKHCAAKFCPQLYEGRIWKCAALAYLQMQNERYRLSAKWDPYLRYRGLEADCSDAELR